MGGKEIPQGGVLNNKTKDKSKKSKRSEDPALAGIKVENVAGCWFLVPGYWFLVLIREQQATSN
jgi:hypothetical protein